MPPRARIRLARRSIAVLTAAVLTTAGLALWPLTAGAELPGSPAGNPYTAPYTGTSCKVGVVGDIAGSSNARDRAKQVKAMMDLNGVGHYVLPGDLAYDNHTVAQADSYFIPVYGKGDVAKVRPSAGNHEHSTTNASGYYTHTFAGIPKHYAYEACGWRMISVDGEKSADITNAAAFIRSEDAKAPDQPTLIQYHKARWSSNTHHLSDPSVDPIWRAAVETQAAVVVNGHVHAYERFEALGLTGQPTAGGVTQFVIGTGGRSVYGDWATTPAAGSAKQIGSTYGAGIFTLNADGKWSMTFRDRSNTVLDSASGISPTVPTPSPSPSPTPTASPTPTTTPPPPATTTRTKDQLIGLVQDVTTANGYTYNTKDSAGNRMDTAKVIDNPAGGWLAVYHSGDVTRLASSTNLSTWTYRAVLDPAATQPTIQALPTGGFITGVEYNAGGGGQLRFRPYASLAALYAGTADKTFTAPRSLSPCNEGTPNFHSINLNPDINTSVIKVGMHHHECNLPTDTDRQSLGTLTNFSTWSAVKQPEVSQALIDSAAAAGTTVNGNIGDRDSLTWGGTQYSIHEVQGEKGATGQNGSFASWRAHLYDHSAGTAQILNMKTHRGSTAFANPTFSLIKDPQGRDAIVRTMFIPSEGAGTGEAGPLIYWKTIPASTPNVVDVRVDNSLDDSEERVSTGENRPSASSDLEMTFDGSTRQRVGLRFNDLGIPQGSTIVKATIGFPAAASSSSTTELSIRGHAIGDAPQFANTTNNIADRPLTTAMTGWSPTSWSSGRTYSTPNVAKVLQEIVDRPDYATASNVAFIVTGPSTNGTRNAVAFDRDPAKAPTLHVEWAP